MGIEPGGKLHYGPSSKGGLCAQGWAESPEGSFLRCLACTCAGSVITELTVGMGPAGELRYPSYPEGDGRWRFPGVGEFQCFDRYMMASLRTAALDAGMPAWCASTGTGRPCVGGGGGPASVRASTATRWSAVTRLACLPCALCTLQTGAGSGAWVDSAG